MSDIYCKCGEPWDLDSLHEHIAEHHERKEWTVDGKPDGKYDDAKYRILFNRYRTDFMRRGCELFGTSHSDCSPSRGDAFAALSDMLGDDVDGAIAMMEDADQAGMF